MPTYSATLGPETWNQSSSNPGVAQRPTGSGLRRRYLPPGVGGATGPAGRSPKPAGGYPSPAPPVASGWSAAGSPAASWNKGGQAGFTPPTPPSGTTAPWMQNAGAPPVATDRPVARPSMRGLFGGFSPSQLVQQNGQWGGMGRGGGFQALGGNALQQWLAHQATQPGATGPMPGPPSPPSGYVTADQFNDPRNAGYYDWFRQGEGAAGRPTDFNAFNQWFQQHGRAFDPAGWDRLYNPVTMTTSTDPAETTNTYIG